MKTARTNLARFWTTSKKVNVTRSLPHMTSGAVSLRTFLRVSICVWIRTTWNCQSPRPSKTSPYFILSCHQSSPICCFPWEQTSLWHLFQAFTLQPFMRPRNLLRRSGSGWIHKHTDTWFEIRWVVRIVKGMVVVLWFRFLVWHGFVDMKILQKLWFTNQIYLIDSWLMIVFFDGTTKR